jgi:hypothetical protein
LTGMLPETARPFSPERFAKRAPARQPVEAAQ